MNFLKQLGIQLGKRSILFPNALPFINLRASAPNGIPSKLPETRTVAKNAHMHAKKNMRMKVEATIQQLGSVFALICPGMFVDAQTLNREKMEKALNSGE